MIALVFGELLCLYSLRTSQLTLSRLFPTNWFVVVYVDRMLIRDPGILGGLPSLVTSGPKDLSYLSRT